MSANCGFGEGLLSNGQRSTSGSGRILYSGRQASWAGEAIGKLEKFTAPLCLVTTSRYHSTSGSVRILYTSRQASWAGKALGKPEDFTALLHLVTKG